MSNVLTSNKLIESVKRRAMIPEDQSSFDSDDILEILNEEMDMFGIPHLLSAHEEYLIAYEDVALVEDQFEYRIPYRAIANKLRDVAYVSSDGRSTYELSRISLEDVSDYGSQHGTASDVFYVMNDKIVLVGSQISSDTSYLRMWFYLRPNTLVAQSRAGIITDIDTTTGVVTMSNFPTHFSTEPDMDFIQAKSPNKIYSYDVTPTAVNSTTKTITFAVADLPSDLAVGDYICQNGETIVPQLPTELHPVLCQRAAIAMMEGMNDSEGVAIAEKKLKKMEKSLDGLIDNRVEGAPQKILNRHSTLREATHGGSKFKSRKGLL